MQATAILASTRAERFTKFIDGLKNGDPTSWAILGGIILLAIFFYYMDKRKEKSGG